MNNGEGTSFLDKAYDPFLQGKIILGFIVVTAVGGVLLRNSGLDIDQSFPWLTAASFMLFFAIFNSLFSVSTKDFKLYWTRSMMTWIALAILGGLLAWGLSFQSISEAGTYRWIYIVLTIGYLIFLSMMRAMRRIVDFAMREEWNAPRVRDRKRRR